MLTVPLIGQEVEAPLLCDLLELLLGKAPFFTSFPQIVFEDHNIYPEPYYKRLSRV